MKSIISTTDPDAKHVIRPIELLRLPRLDEDEGVGSSYRVAIYESPGPNYLTHAMNMGVRFYDSSERFKETHEECLLRMPLEVFVDFAIGACEVLEMLHHGHKIIHGEVRSDAFHFNRESRIVKLLNAGNGARAFEHAGGLTSDGWQTVSKEIGAKNRLQFISPEQSGRLPIEPDTRTDVYSLGVVFWVILVGKPAFEGSSPIEVLSNVLNRRLPSVSSKRPDIPEAVSRIIERMTQKQILQRYQSITGVKHDLVLVRNHLGEGDVTALADLEIGKKDISSFFQLPSGLFARERQREILTEVVERSAKRQLISQSARNSSTLYSISSNSSISENRIEALDLGDAASIASSRLTDTQSPSGSSIAASVASNSGPAGATSRSALATESPILSQEKSGVDSLVSGGKASSVSTGNSHPRRMGSQVNKSSLSRCELVQIIGPAGMGKSSLVHSMQPVFRKYGYFASARFDRVRSQPFSALVSCISSFFRQIFSEKDVSTPYHYAIRSLVGPIWKTLCVTLELPEALLQDNNPQTHLTSVSRSGSRYGGNDRDSFTTASTFSSVPSAQSSAAEYIRGQGPNRSLRFRSLYLELLKLLSRRGIAMVLDDVHNADEESIELISAIVAAGVNCILILCGRELQLSSGADSPSLTVVELTPFNENELVQYIAATLRRSDADSVTPLAAIVHQKCQGNPFYINEMLTRAYNKNCIWFEWRTGGWEYSLDRVFTEFDGTDYCTRLDDNFLTNRLQEVPSAARAILVWASLLGTTFSIKLIMRILSDELLHNSVEEDASKSVIFVRRNEGEILEALQHLVQFNVLIAGDNEDEFQFAHDRLQVAAMNLRDARLTAKRMHFIIARTMMSLFHPTMLYGLAGHICQAVDVIHDLVPHRIRYRDYLYQAGSQASSNGARTTAVTYFENAIKLLQPDPWDNELPDCYYEETLSLYTQAAEIALEVRPDLVLPYVEQPLTRATSPCERAKPWILESRYLMLKGEHQRAFERLRECLVDLGVPSTAMTPEECDSEYEDIKSILMRTPYEELISKPMSNDPHILALGDVLSECLSQAFWNSDSYIYLAIVLRQIRVILTHDSFPQAGIAYGRLATVAINRYDDFEWAQDLSRLSKDLLLGSATAMARAKGLCLYAIFLEHYYHSLQDSLSTLEMSLDYAYQSGDRVITLATLGTIAQCRFTLGQDVRELERFCVEAPRDFAQWEVELQGVGVLVVAVRQVCRALQGKTFTETPMTVLDDEEHVMTDFLLRIKGTEDHRMRMLDPYTTGRMAMLYHFGYHQEAVDLGTVIYLQREDAWATRGNIMGVFYFAEALLALLLTESADTEAADRDQLIGQVLWCKAKIDRCGSVVNTNYLCWSLMIQAGIYELEGNRGAVIGAFEEALDHAQIHNLALDEATAWELHGEFLVRTGSKRTARAMLQEAITSWNRIGASGKARHVATKYEFLLKTAITTRTNDVGCQTLPIAAASNTGIPSVVEKRGSVHQTLSDVGKNRDASILGLDIIDLSNILEFSQVMSSELEVERLLSKMAQILLESVTGQADFCAIIVDFGDGVDFKIAAAGDLDQGITAYPEGLALSEAESLFAQQVSLNAARFKELIHVPQLLEDVRFLNANEELLNQYPLGRSVIAIPILQADHVKGIIHLEGPPNCFTQRNTVVLKLLSNQMGISLANAMLFKRIAKISATNASMVESQRRALALAREAEQKAKVAQADAMKALAQAEEASKTKSLFLANVSHELRTPLNGVIGMSEILKGTNLTTEQEGYTDSIKICADTLLTVINDILDYSKLESGKMGLIRVPVNLTDSITEVVRALAYTNHERGLETFKDLALEPDMLVSADPVRLHQIFMNLLSNAYKFTPKPGKIYVRARVDQEWDSKIQITCEVQDTGIGITKDQLSHLFQPFSQADSSTMRTYGGTGLGLSICKAMIENVMNGTINLESESGKGTKVAFTLIFDKIKPQDRQKPDETTQANRWTPAADDEQSRPSLVDLSKIPRDQIRVCIAEDNPINQKIAVSFVGRLGLQCEAFGDGQQAVDALRKRSKEGKPFHLVLMDVQMPVLDGYNATRELRKDSDPKVRDVLVIAMTASAIRGDREKCIDAGMNDYLAKPVRAAVLKSMIEGYLSQEPQNIPNLQTDAKAMADKALKEANTDGNTSTLSNSRSKSPSKSARNLLRKARKNSSNTAVKKSPSRPSINGTSNNNSNDSNTSNDSTDTIVDGTLSPPSQSHSPNHTRNLSPAEAMAEAFGQRSESVASDRTVVPASSSPGQSPGQTPPFNARGSDERNSTKTTLPLREAKKKE